MQRRFRHGFLAIAFSLVFAGFGCIGVNETDEIVITRASRDRQAPRISDIQVVNIARGSAEVGWLTDEYSDSAIFLAPNAPPSAATMPAAKISPDDKVQHWVSLGDLMPATEYHYFVVSKDRSQNMFISPVYTFVTSTPPPACFTFEVKEYPRESSLALRTSDIAADPDGYVLALRGEGLARVSRDGAVSRLADWPHRLFGVVYDKGMYYASDDQGNLIQVTPAGEVSTRIADLPIRPNFGSDLAMDGDDILMADPSHERLLRIKPDNSVHVVAEGLTGIGQVVVAADAYYAVAHKIDGRVFKITRNGEVSIFADLGLKSSSYLAKIGDHFYIENGWIDQDGKVTACDHPGRERVVGGHVVVEDGAWVGIWPEEDVFRIVKATPVR